MRIRPIAGLCTVLSLWTWSAASSAVLLEEHVTGGALDLTWTPGFGVTNNLEGVTLNPGHAAYLNPSGDHTAGRLVNAIPDEGGIALSCTDPGGASDGLWAGEIFTGAGDSRRGIVVRANPANQFATCYQFVLQPGLLQLSFRKLVEGAPTTLATWFTTDLPGGLPATNSWHSMAVRAEGSSFALYWDDVEVTAGTPIVDSDIASGWFGVYNFRFDIGGIEAFFDDLVLSNDDQPSPIRTVTWGLIKATHAGGR